MSTVEPSGGVLRPARRPIVTWALMLLALTIVLLMPDWTGSGSNRPIWLFSVPIVLGLIGAVFALRTRHFWWALFSALWGFALIQGLVIVITLVSGP